jgi:TRAP-type C4-dicarboxylate transport system permease small subunit
MNEKGNFIEIILNVIQKILTYCICVLLSGLVIVVLGSTISRYFLNYSIAWAEELSRFMLIWTVLMGAVVANHYNEHMGLDILIKVTPKKVSKVIMMVSYVLVLLAVGLIINGGITMTIESIDSLSPALSIPYGYVYAVVPFCGIILLLQTIVKLVNCIKFFIASPDNREVSL